MRLSEQVVPTLVLLFAMPFLGLKGYGQETPHRHHFKKRIELRQDPTQVAVLLPTGGIDRVLREGLPQVRVSAQQVQRHAIADWVVVRFPSRSATEIEQLVNGIAALPSVRFATPIYKDDLGGAMFVMPHVLMGFAEGVGTQKRNTLLQRAGLRAGKSYAALGVERADAPFRTGYEVLAVANTLAQDPQLRFCEPDMAFTVKSSLVPNDPQFTSCWGLLNTGQSGGTVGIDMKASQAWDITTGSASIITVILDNGVEQTHPDLHQFPGTDLTSDASTNGGPVNQFDDHGTAVAGCVSATINNALGTVGVAPGTRSASARTFIGINDTQGSTAISWTVDALNWAVSIGARVTCNSNDYGGSFAAIDAAYTATHGLGIVHFASAGNSALNGLGYPASSPSVNAISAIARTGALAWFSNYNSGLAFSAPGADVNTTDRTGADGYSANDYAVVNGTSFAAPYAAGVAALLLSHVPSLSAAQVEATMQATATDLGTPGFDNIHGYGLVSAFAALSQVVAPSNNVCDALPLVVGNNGPFTNVNSTLQPGEAVPPVGSCTGQGSWCIAASNTVWFKFVAPPNGRISINFGTTQNWDSQIALWSAPTCDALLSGGATLLAANDDITGGVPYHAAITPICVTPGQTYYVQVDGYQATVNNAFHLVLVEEPASTWYADPDADGYGTAQASLTLINEGFENFNTSLANGWVRQNNSFPLGSSGWAEGDAGVFLAASGTPGSYVGSHYTSGSDVATISNWLFTPEVLVANGSQLSFATRTVSAPAYPDRMQVWLSTSGASTDVGISATSTGDFGMLLLDINAGYTAVDYPSGWTTYTVTVSGLPAPAKGRFAFRHFVEGGGPGGSRSDYIGIDAVTYTLPGTLLACTQPFGYVDNTTDNCPVTYGLIGDACDDGNVNTTADLLNASCQCIGTPTTVVLDVRGFLDGAYDPATGLMNDALRALPGFPLTEPYTTLGYTHVGGGGETILPAVKQLSIVDWVVLELRSAGDPASVVASRSAMLLRSGQVVDLTGSGPVSITMPPGNYHVALRHRNHLGCMTAAPVALSGTSTTVNFTSTGTAVHGINARRNVAGAFPAATLWSGDVSFNGEVKYNGGGNDRDPILVSVGGVVPTATISAYNMGDVNLDGIVKYTGVTNDRDPVLQTIGGIVPTASRTHQLP